jgi:hypothetical protein
MRIPAVPTFAAAALVLLLAPSFAVAQSKPRLPDPLGLRQHDALGEALQNVVTFFTQLTEEDLAGASTLATQIPGLQDATGKACWDAFQPIGALVKAHPLPQSLRLATDIEALRLFSLAVKQVCAKPECSQVWSDVANQTAAIGGIPVPALSAVCAKIP